ncbi:MAG TPA: class I SAM-dependent rRNA methyltransferase [Polyangia bacterium]|nr:class I SAM-dependent rRNA methyltransferase [Polyangia bacterium]
MPATPKVILRKNLGRALRHGHPWVFRDALTESPSLPSGTMVAVAGRDGRTLAHGYWDAAGPIAMRVLDLQPVRDGRALTCDRLRDALAKRLARLDRDTTNAFRWVHGEGDRLPGIHVDLYDRVAVVRFDGAGARAFYRELDRLLAECSAPLRLSQVVDRERRSGNLGEIEVRENGIRFIVDLGRGQKGGLFLDQRENRQAVAARAAGKSVLNLYGYTGGFSLYAAAAGATRTDTVDVAKPALATARRNFQLNGLSLERAGFHATDALAFLDQATRGAQRWDVVVSDPPSFAPSRHALPAARSAYFRLHRLAATVVAPGGLLCAASCSSHFPRDAFLASLERGAAAAGRRFRLESVTGAGFDHPALPAFPEGDYLKFAIGRIV